MVRKVGILLALSLLAACAARHGRSETTAPAPFDRILGAWRGTRTDDAQARPMTLRVRPILGGKGISMDLEIGERYRGLHVVMHEPERDRWVSYYANASRGRFSPLEGELGGGQVLWHNVDPDRKRESRLRDEWPEPDRWRRTQEFSEDGGATWKVLFVDELRRE
jgi:hypothetical protein